MVRALTAPGYGWSRHPVAAMWAGYEEALVRYGLDVCTIGCERGNADTCAATLVADLAGSTAIASVRTQEELQAAGEIPRGRASRRFTEESSRAGSPESRTLSAVLFLFRGPCPRCRWGEHSMTAAEDAHTNDGGTDQHNPGGAVVAVAG